MVSEANLGLVPERQQPLRQRCLKKPDAAWITDGATAVVSEPSSPSSGQVEPANNGGTLGVDATVPVGFQRIRCTVRLQVPGGVGGQTLENLTKTAERRCVVLQTSNRGIWVGTDWHIDQEAG